MVISIINVFSIESEMLGKRKFPNEDKCTQKNDGQVDIDSQKEIISVSDLSRDFRTTLVLNKCTSKFNLNPLQHL